MNYKKPLILTVFIISCMNLSAQENEIANDEQIWSEPINGLAAMLKFEIKKSETHAQIIHPKLNLRNETKDTIDFFWCIYDAGEFKITDTNGNSVPSKGSIRSGPVGSEIVSINPGQVVTLDAYDYGYGISGQPNLYAFNTASIQRNLVPENYLISYILDYTTDNLKKIIKQYNWIKVDVATIWSGIIKLEEVPLNLKNDLPTKNKTH